MSVIDVNTGRFSFYLQLPFLNLRSYPKSAVFTCLDYNTRLNFNTLKCFLEGHVFQTFDNFGCFLNSLQTVCIFFGGYQNSDAGLVNTE